MNRPWEQHCPAIVATRTTTTEAEPIMSLSPVENVDSTLATVALPDEQLRRAGVYSVLAALLRDAPNEAVLGFVGELEVDAANNGNELLLSLNMLSLAARHSSSQALLDEYHALFIGLGRGELVPYGSWYQTGFLMEKPLGLLRADLAELGFARSDDVHEPEDHVAALFEVMAMLIHEGTDIDRQQRFFQAHIGNWAERFFDDLGNASSAVFYRSVARFGQAFLAMENRYLSLSE
jgi:TorA maturation chaperone TorD